MSRLSALKKQEVINLEDGRKMGVLCDVDVDLRDGAIKAIMVKITAPCYGEGRFGRGRELIIPYDRVVHAGGDVVIVRAEPDRIVKLLEEKDGAP